MIKKCLILVAWAFLFAPVLLQAQGVDALIEYASSEHKAHFSITKEKILPMPRTKQAGIGWIIS